MNEAVKLTALEAEIPKKAPLIEQWCISNDLDGVQV